MKALVLERRTSGAPKLRMRDVPRPEPGPHDALVRVLACGLCHHDKLAMEGMLRRGIRSPVILGHEICGDVEEVGSEVTLVQPGQRVVPLLTQACGSCERCLAGKEHRCLNGKGIGHGEDGGFRSLCPRARDGPGARTDGDPAGAGLSAHLSHRRGVAGGGGCR